MKITHLDFNKVSKENEYFFWHFLVPENIHFELQPYNIDQTILNRRNPTKEIVDALNIPYFESNTKDEIDFLIGLKNGFDKLAWSAKDGFAPVILAFNRQRLVYNTWKDFCYCQEGFIKMIYSLNPKFIEDVNLD